MAGTYLMNWTNSEIKPAFKVQPNDQDITTTPLVITGRGRFNWGEQLQENMLRMLENFADYTPPANPTRGQTYFNYGTNQLNVYDGTRWTPIGGQVYWADATEFNACATSINSIYALPYGTTVSTSKGYNQTGISLIAGRHATASDWQGMVAIIQKICGHQGTTFDATLTNLDFVYQAENSAYQGLLAMNAKWVALQGMITLLLSNYNNIDPNTRESFTDASMTKTRTAAWTNTITHDLTLTFNSVAHAQSYFNTQGQILMNFSLTNPVDSHDVVWQSQLASIGTLMIQRGPTATGGFVTGSPVGYYNLTASYQRIYSWTSAAMQFLVDIKKNTDGSQINILVTFVDASGSAYGGSVEGTLKSQCTLAKASEIYMNNPEIPYPTAVSAGSM